MSEDAEKGTKETTDAGIEPKRMEALAELPEELTVAGEAYPVYPLSLGKTTMVTQMFYKLSPLLEALQKVTDEKMIKTELEKSFKEVINMFIVITTPNEKGILTKIEDRKKEMDYDEFKFLITIPDIMKMFKIVAAMTEFATILKNVMSLIRTTNAIKVASAGASTLDQSSDSPSGS